MSKIITQKLGHGSSIIPKEQLLKLLAIRGSDIDTSEIPEITEEWFEKAKVVRPKNKILKSVRIDHDVLDFIQKKQGRGYQTLINKILTEWSLHNGMKT